MADDLLLSRALPLNIFQTDDNEKQETTFLLILWVSWSGGDFYSLLVHLIGGTLSI